MTEAGFICPPSECGGYTLDTGNLSAAVLGNGTGTEAATTHAELDSFELLDLMNVLAYFSMSLGRR